ncbi:M6 family metalloprotease domain-containing protein [Streptomyces sp. NPDC005279]|uniref:M6 family metalloprotease domain-containing protein n=1 Tax=Streptomyces sp. NPDC005279 TaxID=3364712 RepID=UPI0036766C4A
MSAIFGENLTFTQEDGGDVELVAFGDDKYARYETMDGYTVVYDTQQGGYCYAEQYGSGTGRRFSSTGVRVPEGPPENLPRHLREGQEFRRNQVMDRFATMIPPDERAAIRPDAMLTFGPNQGLLPGDRVSEGDVRGLTILVTFPGTNTTVTREDVDDMLNSPNFSGNGNRCSVKEFFRTMSTDRLRFTNTVVGPFRMSRPRLAYANVEGLLVPEAIQAAFDAGVDFSRFDSQGRGIVDSVCIMYAGRTEYKGDLWPHNWVHRQAYDGMRTELYTVTSMGRAPDDLSIGTYCHESGHLLCRWPDLYDYGTAEREGDDFTSAGMGTYCVMGAGNHLGDGRTPSPVCVYLRRLVGWCGQDVDIARADNYVAKHGDYDTALIYQHPQRADTEYFLVENRSRDDFDVNLTASGLAVYHCDIDGSNEFQQGTSAHHYQCALMQADGHLDLETNANQGDGGDLYGPTEGTALSHSSRPASLWWDGSESGLTISQVSGPGAVITFRTGTQGVAGISVAGKSSPAAVISAESAGGLTDAITLQGLGTVRELEVSIDIAHPRIGDLRVVLLSPTGRRAVLHNRTGGSTNDLRLSLDSRPPSLLAPLVGEGVTGEWKLRITDAAESSTGKLLHWELHVRTAT